MSDMQVGVYGQYEVWVNDENYDATRYDIVNSATGVIEHDTRVLYEAIRVAKIFDKALIEAHNFDPNSVGWPNQKETMIEAGNDIH